MKKLLYLICLLSFGQIFSANEAEKGALKALLMLGNDLGKRTAHTDGEPAAKRQKNPSDDPFEIIEGFKGSESIQGEDEEFLCQHCGQDLNSQRALDSHEQSSCSQRPDLLNTQQDFIQWQQLFAQQQLLQQQLQEQLFAQQQQWQLQQQLQQWQLQQTNSGAQSTSRIPIPLVAPSQLAAAAPAQANPLEAGVDNSNSQEILCRLCEKSIPTYENFKKHQLEKHYGYKEPDNEIKCRIKNCLMCKNNNRGNPTTFHNNGNRNRHEEVAAACKMPYQRNIGKYCCAHCNTKFTRNHDLQTHIATTCDKVPENLRKEINRSKFTCPHCCSSNPFKFFVLNDLNEHIKDKHTGKELVQIGITAEQKPQAAVSSDDDDEDNDSDEDEV